MYFNTIILQRGWERLTSWEYKKFQKGDTIFGENSSPEELKRWSIEEKEEAKRELEKYRCKYKKKFDYWDIEEYALEYCDTDEEGEWLEGSDYDLAEEEVNEEDDDEDDNDDD